MPILGVIDSGKSGHLSTNSYASIGTVTVGSGGSSSVTFSSIPSTYTHLQIRWLGKSNRLLGAPQDDMYVQMGNGSIDTGSNYSFHGLLGTGSATSVYAGATQTMFSWYNVVASSYAGANVFAGGVLDILDYANTNKYKTSRMSAGFDNNGSGYVFLDSGLWQSNSAITTIKLFPDGGTWLQYSSFALYGVR